MKAGVEHVVPLSDRALAILVEVQRLTNDPDGFVFPGAKPGKRLSVMALTMQMRRMALGHFTVHGFRSSFRDWAGETTTYPRELAEQALAHAVGNATEQAYRRGTALARRREMMAAWERYIAGDTGAAVIDLASKRAGTN